MVVISNDGSAWLHMVRRKDGQDHLGLCNVHIVCFEIKERKR